MRISDKIKEIEEFLEELKSIIPNSFKEYLDDYKSKAACERYAEKIIEASVDLAFILIKDKKLRKPEDDQEAFEILKDKKIISEELTIKLKDAKSMRNFLTHEYGKVDNEIVYNSIKEELEEDINEFINNVESSKKRKNAKL